MRFKLEIDVPEGTTKIDLAPILIPIVKGLMERGHRDTHIPDEQVVAWIENRFKVSDVDERILRLRRPWIVAYVKANGWSPNSYRLREKQTLHYEKRKQVPDPKPEWWGNQSPHDMSYHIRIPENSVGSSSRLGTLRYLFRDLCNDEKRSLEDIVTDIESMAPALFQLAMQAEE